MNVKMEFPNTFEEFLNEYSFIDSDEVYTNGSELIQTLRVMQGYEHFVKQIRNDVIEECIEILRESYPIIDNEDILYGFSCAIHRMEQLKENNNG